MKFSLCKLEKEDRSLPCSVVSICCLIYLLYWFQKYQIMGKIHEANDFYCGVPSWHPCRTPVLTAYLPVIICSRTFSLVLNFYPNCKAEHRGNVKETDKNYWLFMNIIHIYIYIYRVSHEERTKLREGVPYVKLYRYNPKHLYPKLNGYRDNGQRS